MNRLEKEFLSITGVYTCPTCGEEHCVNKSLKSVGTSVYDCEIAIDCSCGLHFELNVDFNRY